jgi:hypothetical protein
MTSLTMPCDRCAARITLDLSCLLLAVTPDADAPGRLAYLCPACHDFVHIYVSFSTATMLLASGCPRVTVDLTLPNPEPSPSGPPFTLDDLIDLHAALASDDWISALACGQP